MAAALDNKRNPERSSRRAHVIRRLERARDLIEERFDEPLCLSDLAAAAFMSDAHFVRQFRREFGITPYRCLTERRLKAARALLIETTMPITDIVVAAGFGNRSAFSRLFKSRFGLSPQAFRIQQRRRTHLRPRTRSSLAVASLMLVASFGVFSQEQELSEPEAPPTCDTPAHRQFDFWIGEWEVYANDKLAGTNKIMLSHSGCVLEESWNSANGAFSGSSLNLYDRARRVWHQSWADSSGTLLQLQGGMKDGAMVLSGTRPAQDGRETVHQITWTPDNDGNVRQHWQVSKDGKIWKTLFDGLYKPIE